MSANNKKEVWLRGPLPEIPALLQPIAHAILQAKEEVESLLEDFDEAKLWEKPSGVASVGFHLQHLTGVLDRLYTYARGELLSENQMRSLSVEGTPDEGLSVKSLFEKFSKQVDFSIEQLKTTREQELTTVRGVGRAQIPSTVLGLLTHGAEHTMRHVGQLNVTVRIQKN